MAQKVIKGFREQSELAGQGPLRGGPSCIHSLIRLNGKTNLPVDGHALADLGSTRSPTLPAQVSVLPVMSLVCPELGAWGVPAPVAMLLV